MFLWKVVIFIALCKAVCMAPNSADGIDLYTCEDGWKKYDLYCFKLVESRSTWRSASANCKNMGGHLVSIHSKEQNDFFEEFAKTARSTYWWIGLHDHETDGIFVWDDGSDVEYTNWRPGEPDGDYVSTGDCVSKSFSSRYAGMWYVLPCSRELPYLCQKQMKPGITRTELYDIHEMTETVISEWDWDYFTETTEIGNTELDYDTDDGSTVDWLPSTFGRTVVHIPWTHATTPSGDAHSNLYPDGGRHRSVLGVAITVVPSAEMTQAAVATTVVPSTEMTQAAVSKAVNTTKENNLSDGFNSVTTVIIIVTIVIILMALAGGMLYWKRRRLQEKSLKEAPVSFRKTEQVT